MIIIAAAVIVAPSLSFGKEGEIKIMTAPLNLMFGAINVIGEYTLKPNINVGFDYLTWSLSIGDDDFSLTTMHPFGRYYFVPDGDSWFAGGGFVSMDIGFGSGGSASASGLAIEGGYNWKWEQFTLDLGYEMWMLGTVESSDGDTFNAGSIAGLLFRIGAYF